MVEFLYTILTVRGSKVEKSEIYTTYLRKNGLVVEYIGSGHTTLVKELIVTYIYIIL